MNALPKNLDALSIEELEQLAQKIKRAQEKAERLSVKTKSDIKRTAYYGQAIDLYNYQQMLETRITNLKEKVNG